MQYLYVMYRIHVVPRVLLLADFRALRRLAVRHLLGVPLSAPQLGRLSDRWSDPVCTVGSHSCWVVEGLGHVMAYDDGNANRTQPLSVHPLSDTKLNAMYVFGTVRWVDITVANRGSPEPAERCCSGDDIDQSNSVETTTKRRMRPVGRVAGEGCEGNATGAGRRPRISESQPSPIAASVAMIEFQI